MTQAKLTQPTIAYFGYGSLVNLGSLRTPYISAHRATLKGWKRTWLSQGDMPDMALLSVVEAQDAEIDGLLIIDHADSLPDLDKREAQYSRVTLDNKKITLHESQIKTDSKFLYVADQLPTTSENKIARSYLDVVMQGYLHQFGEDGLQRFIDTTVNFDIQIIEDRKRPLYPRATQLTEQEKKIFAAFR